MQPSGCVVVVTHFGIFFHEFSFFSLNSINNVSYNTVLVEPAKLNFDKMISKQQQSSNTILPVEVEIGITSFQSEDSGVYSVEKSLRKFLYL